MIVPSPETNARCGSDAASGAAPRKRIGVIGAGPAGLTAALALVRDGAQVEVFESGDQVGGLSRSIDLWGQRVDIGPHRFFSTNKQVNEFWLSVVGENYQMVNRLTRVYFEGKLVDYPIQPTNAMRQLGCIEAIRCLVSYARQKVTRGNGTQSFESWVTQRFGKRLFDVFFRSYSEKLWGIPCDELSADFAAQRIRQFSLWEALRSSVQPFGGKQHKTLVDRFAYPSGGTGAVYDAMAQQIKDRGGKIHTRCPVAQILCQDSHVSGLRLASGETKRCDHIISTMPVTQLVHGLCQSEQDVPTEVRDASSALKFRNTVLVYLHIDSDSLFDDQWLYIQSPDVLCGRVTNFRNWHADQQRESTTILAVEQWCDDEDSRWHADDQALIDQSVSELQQTGLLDQQSVLAAHVMRIRRSYPVYRIGYEKHVQTIARYLSSLEGISLIGRYGAFKYNNQDHSILMGLLAAENILLDAQHDLWGINSDFDSYQEQSRVTASGMVVFSD